MIRRVGVSAMCEGASGCSKEEVTLAVELKYKKVFVME